MTEPSTERPAVGAPAGAPTRRVWRDNLEAFTMALVVAVMLKYFVVEAYRIPSGSMQPTLMGWNDGRGGGLFDRVLVDKLSYHQRDPERFEVVVFQFPLDRSKHFIKRLVGMPGDHLRIRDGDLWLELPAADGELSWQILRRPAGVQESHWFAIEHEGRWNLGSNHSQWKISGTALETSGPGRTSFPGDTQGVKDLSVHGYPQEILEYMGRPTRAGGQHDVGDLRLATEIQARPDCSYVRLVIEEGGTEHVLELPGPAAPAEARVLLRSSGGGPSKRLDRALSLTADRSAALRFWNLDDRLQVEWNGELLLSMDIPPAAGGHALVHLESEGGGASFTDIELERDLYYDQDTGLRSSWHVPEDHYVVLGDNSVDSADSRAWELASMRSTDDNFAGDISGLRRQEQNPTKLLDTEHFDAMVFRDEWGERRAFRSTRVHSSLQPAPFVARHFLRGRAISVFWPWKPTKSIYRLHWVH